MQLASGHQPSVFKNLRFESQKGLHYHYPDYDYHKAIFTVVHVPVQVDALAKLESIKNVLVYDERGKGVFQYRRGLTDSKQSGLWIFLFYEAVLLLVAHQKNLDGPY
jgi:hypothetical protein